ncbi:ACT domain-containing protein [Undibacterium sp.]|uniref:ACT domain-containing protein n=1 Tax=Undibacterium sp. TaxID=1914977 RepID=UPI0025E0B21C|nr:ACT domain-containing protein [Undibacterium sp.]
MTQPTSDLNELLKSMQPVLNLGVFVFASIARDQVYKQTLDPALIVASIHEPEGLSVIMAEQDAQRYGLQALFSCAWITLTVHSDLQAVGLTAAFATALGDAGISCNVVAGAYHDHLFVPLESAQQAMNELLALQNRARRC